MRSRGGLPFGIGRLDRPDRSGGAAVTKVKNLVVAFFVVTKCKTKDDIWWLLHWTTAHIDLVFVQGGEVEEWQEALT